MIKFYCYLPPYTSRIKVQTPELACLRISAVLTPARELIDEIRLDVSMFFCFMIVVMFTCLFAAQSK
jgi:hypothetical protein